MYDEKQIQEYWKSYKNTGEMSARDALIIHYSELVKFIAGRLYIKYNKNVDYDDIMSCGIIGLIDAIEKFDLEKNIKFETYAGIRIRGAIVDELRNLDWVPRSIRKKYNDVEKAMSKLQSTHSMGYTDEQLAQELGIEMDELPDLLRDINVYGLVSLEEKFENQIGFDIKSEEDSSPETIMEANEMIDIIRNLIDKLPENEKMVISLYYYDELTYKEIAKIMGLSESRISQLHTKIITNLNIKISEYMGA